MSGLKFTDNALLVAMLHPELYDFAKNNVEILKKYFGKDGLGEYQKAIFRVLEKTSSSSSITEDLIISELFCSKYDANTKEIFLNDYKDIINWDPEIVKNARNALVKGCYSVAYLDTRTQYKDDPVQVISKLKDFSIIESTADDFPMKVFSQLDVNSAIEMYDPEKVIKSSYKFINDSCTAGGYLSGQIIQVTAKPSTGKSLWLMGESINFIRQNKKVHYLALGDLKESDFIIRMLSIYYGIPKEQVEMNIYTWFEMACKEGVLDEITITIVPSKKITPTRYVDIMKNLGTGFDVCIIDYDSNFNTEASANMYFSGGDLYDKLTEITSDGKLVFIASQPKREFFSAEVIPGDASGESSRKYHICDMIITIGKNPDSRNPIGKFSIGKNRRGEEVSGIPYIRTSDGLFYECSNAYYSLAATLPYGLSTFKEHEGMDNSFMSTEKLEEMSGEIKIGIDALNKSKIDESIKPDEHKSEDLKISKDSSEESKESEESKKSDDSNQESFPF